MNFDTLAILKNVRIFSELSDKALAELQEGLISQKFNPGDCLMKCGEQGSDFYIIVSGETVVENSSGDKVTTLTATDYCGEQGLMRKTKRNATVRALTVTETLKCDKKLFDRVLKDNVSFVKRDAKRKAVLANIQKYTQGDTKKTEEQRKWIFNNISDNIMFSPMDEERRYVAIDQMYLEKIPKGHNIIVQGEKNAQTFYVVEQGNFDIFVDEKLVASIPRSGCFGELALLYNRPRAATCTATENCLVWTLNRNAFREAITELEKKRIARNRDFLKSVKILEPLLTQELNLLDAALVEVSYKAGTTILQQGEKGEKFYIIKRGTAAWSKVNKDGSKENGFIPENAYFGELALLNNKPRAATVAAHTDLRCLELSRENFEDLLGPLEQIMRRKFVEYEPKVKVEKQKFKGIEKLDRSKICLLKEFKTIGILGKGAFGVVSLVVDPHTKKSYALKAIKKHQIVELGQQSHIVNEKKIMDKLHNPFLVNLQNTYKDKYRVYFLLDVCLGGELFTILRKRRYFDEVTSKFYSGCVIEAFDYMHSQNIIYRDLKPENLVLDENGFLKVTDFGFAKKVDDRTFTLCGTPDYLAPEIVTGQGHGKGVDWWTLGILIYEMLASFPPFFDDEAIETYKKIIKCRIKFPRYFSPASKELIKGLLRSKPNKRLGIIRGGANLIRRHTWFKEFNWEKLQNFQSKPPIVPKVRSHEDISNFEHCEDEHEELKAVAEKDDFDHEF